MMLELNRNLGRAHIDYLSESGGFRGGSIRTGRQVINSES